MLADLIMNLNEIHSKFLIIESCLRFLWFLYVVYVPFVLVFFIRNKLVKTILLLIGLFFVFLGSLMVAFVGVVMVDDVVKGNGFRQIFEKEISGNVYFSIYRSPDQGAMGGDHRMCSVDRKFPLGFVKRHFLLSSEYYSVRDTGLNTETFFVGQNTIFVDYEQLKGKGDLKPDN